MFGKVLAMTGASSGIGACFLKQGSEHFEKLITFGRSHPEFQSEKISHRQLDLKESVRSQISSESLPQEIDVLVLCAGSDFKGRTDFLSNDFSIWEETIHVNYLRTLELVHLLLPRILKSELKTLVAVTSTNIDYPANKCLAYTSAKTALRSVLENLRLEYASAGLRVIEICPSITKTNFAENRTGDPQAAEQFYSTFRSVLRPEDVANSIFWAIQQNPQATISKLEIHPTVLSR